ncbi:lysophospholipid acyltransferase family protein [Sphingorhabdus sp.]|uniref:lysophospholipid acyltransferase family protein n=1 Tax=Sphingorhabdus sp. TaxID=1902408 RepID=UPI00391915F5
MIAVIRSALYILVFYTGSVFFVVTAFLAQWFSIPLMQWAVQGWSKWQYSCYRRILGIRIKVEGTLPQRPVLYAIKHESMFETIDMPRMFRKPAVVTKKELFDIPLWGPAARAYGMIPVDRNGGAAALRAMLALARKMIAEGRPIVIFPEGTRVAPGSQPPLQSGFAGLYKLINLPVVPIAVNSGTLCPRKAGIWKSGTITYKVGEELPTGLPRAEIEARVHAAINALNV